MTTIAWDGKTLAGDRCSWSGGGIRTAVQKIFTYPKDSPRELPEGPGLIGFAGQGTFAMQVLAWIEGQGPKPVPTDWFDKDQLNRQCALIIDRDRHIWVMEQNLYCLQYDETLYAIGAGHEIAWGALMNGATAARAIETVMLRADWAGLGVDTLSFPL